MKLYIFTFLFVLLFVSSCVDIIDLEIDSSTSRPVIEGYIDNGNPAMVSVTMSAAYDEVIDFTQLKDVVITLSDSKGNSEVLKYMGDSAFYSGSTIRGRVGEDYTVDILIDTAHFSASSHLSSQVAIDSVTCTYNKVLSDLMQMGGDRGADDPDEEFLDSLFDIKVYYTDPTDEDNYYLTRIGRNGELLLDYNLNKDYEEDGESLYSFFMQGLSISDTLSIALYSIDKESYTYYQGLDDLGGSEVPYNPYTNIKSTEDVLGFFAARYVDSTIMLLRDNAKFPME